jgi:hypothetical protein
MHLAGENASDGRESNSDQFISLSSVPHYMLSSYRVTVLGRKRTRSEIILCGI